MLLTLNQVISQITTLGAAHLQIQSTGVGDFAEWQALERAYPLLWVFHETTSIGDRELVYSIRLVCADRVITGEEGDDTAGMEQEVLSDTLLILLDFLAYFQQQHAQSYKVITSASIDPFTERFNDRVAGNSVLIQIRQPFTWDACQIPQTGATIPPSVDGLTLYDFCDPSVIARLTPSQVACLEAEYGITCADGNIELNGVQVATVASGGTEDIAVLSEGSNPVGSLVGSDWVIENNATTINGVQVTDQEAEQDAAIFVTRDGVQNGTWNAGTQTWEVTSAPCSPVTFQINAVNKESITSGTTFNLITKLDGAVNSGSYDAPTDTLSFTSAACSPVALQINGTPQESIAAGATFNLIATLDGVAGGTYNAATDTLAFTSSGNWVRPSFWPALPTLTAASEAMYVLYPVYENRLNQYTLATNSGRALIDWGDGTSVASNGLAQTKVYNYAGIAGTVYVDALTGENYKFVIIGVTRTGLALTFVYVAIAPVSGAQRVTSFELEYNISLPNATELLIGGTNTREPRFVKILRLWAFGAASLFRLYNFSTLEQLQLPATMSGLWNSAFSQMGSATVGNINYGASTGISGAFNNARIKSHGNLTANSATIFNSYAANNVVIVSFGTINSTSCTSIGGMFDLCLALQTVGLLTIPNCTNYSDAFSNCQSLLALRVDNAAACTNTSGMIANNYSLQVLDMPNLTRGVNFTNSSMGNYGMNIFANGIGTASGAQTITITGTPFGALVTAADATALAIRAVMTGKGYTIAN